VPELARSALDLGENNPQGFPGREKNRRQSPSTSVVRPIKRRHLDEAKKKEAGLLAAFRASRPRESRVAWPSPAPTSRTTCCGRRFRRFNPEVRVLSDAEQEASSRRSRQTRTGRGRCCSATARSSGTRSSIRGAARRAAARLSPQLLPVVARQPRLAAKGRASFSARLGWQLPRRDVSHRGSPRGGRAAPPVAPRNGARRLRAALGEG